MKIFLTSLSLSFISSSASSPPSSSSSLSCIPRSRSSDKPEYSSYSDGLGTNSSCVWSPSISSSDTSSKINDGFVEIVASLFDNSLLRLLI